MKKIYLFFSLVTTLAFVGCRSTKSVPTQQVADDKSIVILYDNDVHCDIEVYAKLAGLRDVIQDTAYVAVVSSGDFLQGGTAGAISNGQYIIDIMKHVHYDAVTLGNHEFDYSVPTMQKLLAQIGAPVTCVNFRDMQNKRFYEPYVIKQMGRKKVAFIGTVTPTTMDTEAYSFFDKDDKQLYDLAQNEVYQLVQEQVDEVRRQGADYVVILAHLGEDKNDMNVDSHGLIQSTNGIDVVLDGHTHSVIPQEVVNNKDGQPVLVTQTGTKFQNVGKLLITPQGKKSTELISDNKLTVLNIEVHNATDSIQKLSEELVKRPICVSDVDLRILDDKGNQAVRYRETNAGDIVTDAYRVLTGADFAMTNGGGIRTEVKAGNLTYGDIVSLLPYNNYLSIVEITGQQVFDILDGCTKKLPLEDGDFPQVSGLKYTVNVNAEQRITDVVYLNKATNEYEPIEKDKTYQLATIDYCIVGGGLKGVLKKNHIIKPNIMIYNEALIKFVTDNLKGHIGKEYAEPQGRITIKP